MRCLMKSSKFGLLAAFTAMVFLAGGSSPAWSQTTFGAVQGEVTDETGGVIPGVTVTMTNAATGRVDVVVTNEAGLYTLPNLNPGQVHTLRVELPGFQTQVIENVIVATAELMDLDFELGVQTLEETVLVRAETPLVRPASVEVEVTIDQRTLSDMPLNSRDFSRMVIFSPTGKVLSGGVALIAFGGTDIAQNNWLLDGTDATHIDNSFMSNGRERGARLQWASIESVQEFRVLESNFSAEYGRAAGAVVTAITKSGTNDHHGTGYFFLRDEGLDAKNFFDAYDKPQPEFNLKQFGGALGGPIAQNKAFFFANYEGSRKNIGSSVAGTVFSPAYRATLPAELLPLIETVPLPDSIDASDPRVGTVRLSGQTEITENIASGRVDFRPSDNDNIFARVNVQDSLVDGPLFGTSFGTDRLAGPQRQFVPIISTTSTISWTKTIRNNLQNEAKFGFNRVHLVLRQTVPGFFELGDLASPAGLLYPRVDVTGVDVRIGGLQDIDRTNKGFEIIDNLTWFKGRHTVKSGFNIRRRQSFPFSQGYPNVRYNSLDLFQSNLISRLDFREAGGPGTVYGWEQSYYMQDTIRMDRVTLNLGVRYDYDHPFQPADDGTEVADFDAVTGLLLYDQPSMNGDRNNLAPRLGVTYDLRGDGQTILGGGYGVYYHPFQPQTWFGRTLFANVQLSTTKNQITDPGVSFPIASLSGGATAPPNRESIDPNKNDNFNHQFTVNLQQQVGSNMSTRIAYVGNRSRNNQREKPGNLVDPVTGMRPQPQFSRIDFLTWTGIGNYNALTMQFTRRLSDGLAMNAGYTFSKFEDDIDSPQTPCSNQLDFLPCASWDLEYSLADEDIQHNFSFNTMWELPLGEGRFLEGWQLNNIILARTGVPFTVDLGTSRAGVGWFTNQRPDSVPGVSTRINQQGPSGWLNSAAFSDPAAGTYGNLGRNTEIGPSFFQWDLSLIKNTLVQGSQSIQLRFEVFNVLNKPIWTRFPQRRGITSSSFGEINNTFGRTESFGTARQVQLGIKYIF